MAAPSLSPEISVNVLFVPGLMAAALVAGLGAVGWQIGDGADTSSSSPIVVAVDGGHHTPVREIGYRQVPQLVLVGGIDYLDMLADTAMTLGASAVIDADLPYPELIYRVDVALREGPASPQRQQRLYARLRERQAEAERFKRLTNREAEVLAHLACGLSAVQIAALHHVALPTVRSQIAGILRKIEVTSQPAALSLVQRSCRDHRVLDAMRTYRSFLSHPAAAARSSRR